MLFNIGHGHIVYYPRDREDEAAIIDDLYYRRTDCRYCGQVMAMTYDDEPYGGKGGKPGGGVEPEPQHECPGLSDRNLFRFLFKTAAETEPTDDMVAELDALADAMGEPLGDPDSADLESSIPPVFTYLGQFIDHDITANTDREEGAGLERFNIDRRELTPVDRDDVEEAKVNLRRATLDLDSLYGDGPNQSAAAMRAEDAMRDPADRSKFRLGTVNPVSGTPAGRGAERPPLPADDHADLPRFGEAIDDPTNELTADDVEELVNDPKSSAAGRRRLPLIGDGRNDENLIVAQLHLAFLRFHNAMAEGLVAEIPDPEARFVEARRRTRWTYQWLVVNSYLPTICDPAVVDDVLARGADLYAAFFEEHSMGDDCGRPMPLEFSVAAFRFGHTMVRGSYDFNRNFGEPGHQLGRASFDLLFAFTGSGDFAGTGDTLPDNWIIEWDRFVDGTGANRVARKLDTDLAIPLNSLPGMDMSGLGIMKKLAARNLRRGYLFNLPSAQAVIEDLRARGISVRKLSKRAIGSGRTGTVVRRAGFDDATPLWFYVLKEAEENQDGERLGHLGSLLVAETLLGLLLTDKTSYLTASPGWSPATDGIAVAELSDLFRVGGVL